MISGLVLLVLNVNHMQKYFITNKNMDSFSNATCPTCNAQWFGGQLYWSTGKEGDPHDLAGLVCNTLKNYGYVKENDCINPCRGSTSGMTWQHRNFML